jgi:Flp pilus assembly protein TadD
VLRRRDCTTYDKALALRPELVEAHQQLAYLYDQSGRLDDAKAA